MEESSVDPRAVEYARMFLTAGGRRPSAGEVRNLIIQMMRHMRRLGSGRLGRLSPPEWFCGHDTLLTVIMHGQQCVLAPARESSFAIGVDARMRGMTRLTTVMVTDPIGEDEQDRFDPISFRWDARPDGNEMVAWGFKRGRLHEAAAMRPLGSTAPWSAVLSGEFRAGETLTWFDESPVRATTVADDQRPALLERVDRNQVRLVQDAMVVTHRSDQRFANPEDAFVAVTRLLPGAEAANPGRVPDSRLS